MGVAWCPSNKDLHEAEIDSLGVGPRDVRGADRSWLYVTQGGKLFRRQTKRTGATAWETIKPPQPGL